VRNRNGAPGPALRFFISAATAPPVIIFPHKNIARQPQKHAVHRMIFMIFSAFFGNFAFYPHKIL